MQTGGFDGGAQRLALAQQMGLTGKLVEAAGSHLRCERLIHRLLLE